MVFQTALVALPELPNREILLIFFTEIMWDAQTPNSVALDALCRMFPATSPSFNDLTQPQIHTSFNSFGYNPWEGFMDTCIPSLNGDFSDPKNGTS